MSGLPVTVIAKRRKRARAKKAVKEGIMRQSSSA